MAFVPQDPLPAKLRHGEEVTAAHIHALQRNLGQLTRQYGAGGRGVRHRWTPWGVIPHYQGGVGGSSPSSIFLPTVQPAAGGSFTVSWQKGTIAGIEPIIPVAPGAQGGPAISSTPTPKFTVTRDQFGDNGQCLVYFELQFDHNWIIQQIVPVASPQYLVDAPWTAHKLALVLYNDGRPFWRRLYRNIGWIPANAAQTSGKAEQFFWAIEA